MATATVLYKEADKRLITRAYRKLLRSIPGQLDQDDKTNIRRAYELAVEAHHNQRRKSGEPYILHPIEVARICVEEIGLGPTAIICALLHDVVEDTAVPLKEIEKTFGKKISKIVDGLTKLDGLYNVESPQAENFKKVLSTLLEDVRVILIKMADRLHNLRTIGAMPRHKQLRIAAETSYIYAPLAHRLGLYNLKTEFQDLCMKITERDTYDEILRKLQETKRERQRYISEFIKPLKKELDRLKVPYRVFGRPKSVSSIWNKIKAKKVPFEEIYDLFAVRIVMEVEQQREKPVCWQVYSIVTDVHTPIPERLKDWITTPKSNGYESLHTTVIGPKGKFVEVQIRSERMDQIAEKGFAAHWKYKRGKHSQDMYEVWFDSIRDILESQHTDAVEFLNDFKTNLFQEEVYVYTPKGDLKILPKGATALDFAFAIHSDIGYHCTAVKVNNKLVPMGYPLQHGDQVSVTTSKNQKPSEDWLKLVVTGKARSKIRSSMKEERRRVGELGKEALERKIKNLKLDFDEGVDKLVKHYDVKTRVDLYYQIATDQIDISEVRQVLQDNIKAQSGKMADVPVKTETRFRKKFNGQPKILINGEPAEQYNYILSNCCNPVNGDDIFAFLTSSSGLKIHRTNCPNATHLVANYGYRVMKAEWVSSAESSFVVDLIVTGIDQGPGVIERLTNNISTNLGINIRSFSIEGNEGYFEGKMSIIVLNRDQMNQAIRTLKNMPEVSNVVRRE